MVEASDSVDRPPQALVEAFGELSVAVLADVTDADGTVMDHGIKPITSGTTVVGTALPVRVPPGDNLTVQQSMAAVATGDVLVIDAGGDPEVAIWGELLSTSASALNLAGTVVDGAVRDVRDVMAMDYPVFARAVSPKPPEKTAAGSIAETVTCGGVNVSLGDIVVADRDGVAVIESDQAERVLDDARAKIRRESDLKQLAEEGGYLYDELGLDEVAASPPEITDSDGE